MSFFLQSHLLVVCELHYRSCHAKRNFSRYLMWIFENFWISFEFPSGFQLICLLVFKWIAAKKEKEKSTQNKNTNTRIKKRRCSGWGPGPRLAQSIKKSWKNKNQYFVNGFLGFSFWWIWVFPLSMLWETGLWQADHVPLTHLAWECHTATGP